jgi:hypothetical protein
VLTGLGIMVAKMLVPCGLSNFWIASHPETLSHPNDNGVVLQWTTSELPHVIRKLEMFLYMCHVISLLYLF